MPAEDQSVPGIGAIKPKVLRWSREPFMRFQVIAIWMFVAVLSAVTKGATAWHVFVIVSAACLAFFVWPFLEGPFRLRAGTSLPLRANYQIMGAPAEDSAQRYRVSGLRRLGFVSAGHLAQEASRRNVGIHIEMFLHPENRDSAGLAEVVGGLRTIHVLAFKSRFEDGFAFETSNSHTPSLFKPDPNYPVFRFPDVRSTRDLYRLHRKIKEEFIKAHIPVLADNGGELAEFIARAEMAHQRQAQCADYELAPNSEYYTLTWRGAIRRAWLSTWPIKSIREMSVHSRGMKIAKELGLPINPKLGCIQDPVRKPDPTA